LDAEIAQAVEPLLGQPCWDVRWDCSTGLTLEFGAPTLSVGRVITREYDPARPDRQLMTRTVYPHGEHAIWIEVAYWKLTLPEILPVTQSSSYRRILMGTSRLNGQILTSVTVNPRNGFSCFTFDLGALLEVRRVDAGAEYSMWTLYSSQLHRSLEVRGDGFMAVGSSESTVKSWRPMQAGLTSASS
jgi:hypothetical protein